MNFKLVAWWLFLPLTFPVWAWSELDRMLLQVQRDRATESNQLDLSRGLRFVSWSVLLFMLFAGEIVHGCYSKAMKVDWSNSFGDAVFGTMTMFMLHAFFAGGILHSVGSRLYGWLTRTKAPAPDTHGSAAFRENFDRGFLTKEEEHFASAVGHFPGGVGGNVGLQPFFFVENHVMTIAATGAGKGTGCVVPQLLLSDFSSVVLDPKGENFAIAARNRKERGHEVLCMDPFGLTGEPSTPFNPLSVIDTSSEDCVSDAQELASALIVRGKEADSHWSDSAQRLLEMTILVVASRGGGLEAVRDFVTESDSVFSDELKRLGEQRELAGGAPARIARSFLAKDKRESSGVLSTLHRHLAFLDDPLLARSLQGGDFNFDSLRERAVDVFVVLPPHKMAVASRWVRLVLGSALSRMTRSQSGRRVQFLVDEFPSLGRFDAFENAVSIMRGFGVSFWFLCQDLSQLKAVYPRWQTFLSNCTLQAFGIHDEESAEMISRMTGDTTVLASSSGTSRGQSINRSDGSSEARRRLMTPDEVRRLDEDLCLVFQSGESVGVLRRPTYFEVGAFKGMFDANPTR
jgi:type IV secretory pathway TraG/TraD family ATPase VirD4